MAGPFKLKSGNGPLKFKDMGSSPVKHGIPNWDHHEGTKTGELHKSPSQEGIESGDIQGTLHRAHEIPKVSQKYIEMKKKEKELAAKEKKDKAAKAKADAKKAAVEAIIGGATGPF